MENKCCEKCYGQDSVGDEYHQDVFELCKNKDCKCHQVKDTQTDNMKYSIWCKLFGHIFIDKPESHWEGLQRVTKVVRIDWCVNCGLTKAELGITNQTQ